jgi:tetratricopeptide (TPR) repeat protein
MWTGTPEQRSSLWDEVLALCKQGKNDQARKLCEVRLLEAPEAAASINLALASIARSEGDTAQEERLLLDAAQLAGRHRGVHHDLMIHYIEHLRYAEAIEQAYILLELDRSYGSNSFTASANIHAAYCWFMTKRYPEAKEALANCKREDFMWIGGTEMSSLELWNHMDLLG